MATKKRRHPNPRRFVVAEKGSDGLRRVWAGMTNLDGVNTLTIADAKKKRDAMPWDGVAAFAIFELVPFVEKKPAKPKPKKKAKKKTRAERGHWVSW